MFTSDNGYHLGHFRLMQGKRTAYEPDIRVPFVVAGPGVPAGVDRRAVLASNVDLAPTFLRWAGVATRRAGRPVARARAARPRAAPVAARGARRASARSRRGRAGACIAARPAGDPDAQGRRMGHARDLRRASARRDHLYVEHRDGSRELYDLRTDPFELENLAGVDDAARAAAVAGRLARLRPAPARDAGAPTGCAEASWFT